MEVPWQLIASSLVRILYQHKIYAIQSSRNQKDLTKIHTTGMEYTVFVGITTTTNKTIYAQLNMGITTKLDKNYTMRSKRT